MDSSAQWGKITGQIGSYLSCLHCSGNQPHPHKEHSSILYTSNKYPQLLVNITPPPHTHTLFSSFFGTRVCYVAWASLLLSQLLKGMDHGCVLPYFAFVFLRLLSFWDLNHFLCFILRRVSSKTGWTFHTCVQYVSIKPALNPFPLTPSPLWNPLNADSPCLDVELSTEVWTGLSRPQLLKTMDFLPSSHQFASGTL